MTVWKVWACQCDICEDACGGSTTDSTAAEKRRVMKEMGWHQRPGGRDICTECWDAGER